MPLPPSYSTEQDINSSYYYVNNNNQSHELQQSQPPQYYTSSTINPQFQQQQPQQFQQPPPQFQQNITPIYQPDIQQQVPEVSTNNLLEKQCRCCLETDHPEDMIAPCLCSGSIKYVHRSCLNHWRTISPNPNSLTRCDICHADYTFRTKAKKHSCLPWLKFIICITFDIGIILVAWQVLVLLLTLISWASTLGQALMTTWNITNYNVFGVNYLIGLILFFFIIGCISIVYGFVVLFCDCLFSKKGANGEGGTTGQAQYEYNTYPYYRRDSYWDWFFLWYFWSFWNPYPSPIGFCNCYCPTYCCYVDFGRGFGSPGSLNCGNCNFGDCKCDGDVGYVLIIIIVVVVLLIAFLGFLVGCLVFTKIVIDIVKRRIRIVQRKQEIDLSEVANLEQA
jgi:hypothetical protein